jgi:hypothetical protein
MQPLTQLLLLIVVIVRIIMGGSRDDANLILGLLLIAVKFLCDASAPGSPALGLPRTMEQMPTTSDTIMNMFGIDGKYAPYAACPECNCTYPVRADGSYPVKCTNKPEPEEQCEAVLLNENGTPLKPFVHHVIDDFVAGLLSRPDLERYCNSACDAVTGLADPSVALDGVHNPFEAEFIRQFMGPDGERLFVSRGDEVRLAFTFAMDFFNAEGTSRRGKHGSIGLLSLACLNLPDDIRYLPENMWIDVVPGPVEPALTETNHYVRPIVDEFVHSWYHGTKISRTALSPNGRIVRCAIVNAVCDLPAARKAFGFASHGHRIFCPNCNAWHDVDPQTGKAVCRLQTLLGRTDFENWSRRDCDILRAAAEAWRDAPTSAEQERLFEENGVRWSEFWRLPYWNPVRMLVVDAMHCLLEGLCRNHTLRIIHMTATDAKSKVPRQAAFSYGFAIPHVQDEPCLSEPLDQDAPILLDDEPEDSQTLPPAPRSRRKKKFGEPWTRGDVNHVSQIHEILTAPWMSEGEVTSNDHYVVTDSRFDRWLNSRTLGALQYVANDLRLNVQQPRRKADHIKALRAWVSSTI